MFFTQGPLLIVTFFVDGPPYNTLSAAEQGGCRMTVVYIDALFLLNLAVNYLLLLSAGRLAGERLYRGRLALGAALGGLYAAAVFLPGGAFLLHPLCKLGAAVLMLLCAYGKSRRLLRVSLVFFGVSAAFGGGIFAITLLGGRGLTLKNGVFYSGMDLRLILLSAAGCYVLLTAVFGRSARHGGGELRPVRVRLGERQADLIALVDTGHTLTDPITGAPVLVAEGERLSALFPEGAGPGQEDLRDPAAALERLGAAPSPYRFRLLPYRAVGVDCGFLLALRADSVRVGREEQGAMLVALSPTPVSDGGGYSALIGA